MAGARLHPVFVITGSDVVRKLQVKGARASFTAHRYFRRSRETAGARRDAPRHQSPDELDPWSTSNGSSISDPRSEDLRPSRQRAYQSTPDCLGPSTVASEDQTAARGFPAPDVPDFHLRRGLTAQRNPRLRTAENGQPLAPANPGGRGSNPNRAPVSSSSRRTAPGWARRRDRPAESDAPARPAAPAGGRCPGRVYTVAAICGGVIGTSLGTPPISSDAPTTVPPLIAAAAHQTWSSTAASDRARRRD